MIYELGMVEFIGSFQDKQFLYFVCEHCPFGDLGNVVWDIYQEYKKDTSQDVENLIKIYIYQIATAIIYLHKEGIAHLDIKPKNIIIDKSFNLRLTDFATCYFFEEQRQPPELIEQIKKFQHYYVRSVKRMENEICEYRSTFVGTPEYISPEMISHSKASKEADLWALGCIIYEFYHGKQPFSNNSENEIFNSILSLNYQLNQNLPEDVSDLIRSLLTLNPQSRLGYEDSEQILSHKYFDTVRHFVFQITFLINLTMRMNSTMSMQNSLLRNNTQSEQVKFNLLNYINQCRNEIIIDSQKTRSIEDYYGRIRRNGNSSSQYLRKNSNNISQQERTNTI